jgi:hypothetical protein
MQNLRPIALPRMLTLLSAFLILKVTIAVVLNYRNYLPPNFQADFLRGRESYFAGSYQAAFYAHIAAGPVTLVLGLILLSERFRRSLPNWHRRLGRIQGMGVLLLVAPSGLWMAYYAQGGPIAGVGFATLAVLTATFVALGWRSAVKRRFPEHRLWMWRTFLMLCSAVVIRILGGLATVTGMATMWMDPVAAWVSWLAPLTIFESSRALVRRDRSTVETAIATRRSQLPKSVTSRIETTSISTSTAL